MPSTELVTISCAHEGCAHLITFTADVQDRYRKNHANFYCPAGHSCVYSAKTEEEKTIESLRADLARVTADAVNARNRAFECDRELRARRERKRQAYLRWKKKKHEKGAQ